MVPNDENGKKAKADVFTYRYVMKENRPSSLALKVVKDFSLMNFYSFLI
jgi:hypothetical protein